MSAEPILAAADWQAIKRAPAAAQNGPAASHDFETKATEDLKKTGLDRYVRHKHTSITKLGWAIADDPISVFSPGDRDPHLLLDHIENGGMLDAWNAPFEIGVWHHVIPRQFPHWPIPRVEQFNCTMARAQVLSLPASLEQCAIAVNVEHRKDRAGYNVMMRTCRPTKAWRENPVGEPVWEEDPELLKKLGAYCAVDVEVERAIGKQLAHLSKRERKVWLFDRKVNQRGILIDTPKVEAALRVVDAEKVRLNEDLKAATGGKVKTANSPKQMLGWLKDNGLEVANLKRRPLSRLLRSDTIMSADVRRALEIRLEIARASTAKLNAMIACMDEDHRCRGCFSYHSATTGRWAARRIQPHNFPRPILDAKGKPLMSDRDVDEVIELLGCPDDRELIRITYADPMPAIATALRGMLIAAPGKRFIGGDFTGVENRVLAWLSDEKWALEEYVKLDAGHGVDLYKLAYSRAFNVPIESVTPEQRLIGKVMVLACGFAGAVGAFIGMADNYENCVPGDIARTVKATADKYLWDETAARYPKEKVWQFGLPIDTWTGIRVVVDAWRAAHPNITQSWWNWKDATLEAVQQPKTVVKVGKLGFVYNGNFLFIRLPSGRLLSYARPQVQWEEFKYKDGTITKKPQVYYFGQGKKSRKWEKRRLTPQIISENVTSGTARDILVDGMLRLEDRGYEISLHIHDEAVSEVDLDFGSPEEFREILCDSEPWLTGLPVAAKTWTGSRFQK